jgi:hypothetical protein
LETLKINIYHQEKTIQEIPPKLKYLLIHSYHICNELEDHGFLDSLPNSIETLILKRCVSIRKLPRHIINFTMNDMFNQHIDLPETLEYINFGYSFNCPLIKIPSKLKTLIFGMRYNRELPSLPETLEILIFGYDFNCQIDYLPQNLKELTFGTNFNSKLPLLPNSIINLYFGCNFNQNIINFPTALQKLVFSNFSMFNYPLTNLPYGIRELTLGKEYNNSILNLPKSVQLLTLCNINKIVLSSIPYFIENLIFCAIGNYDFHYDILKYANLPMILKNLTLKDYHYLDNANIQRIPFGCNIHFLSTYVN